MGSFLDALLQLCPNLRVALETQLRNPLIGNCTTCDSHSLCDVSAPTHSLKNPCLRTGQVHFYLILYRPLERRTRRFKTYKSTRLECSAPEHCAKETPFSSLLPFNLIIPHYKNQKKICRMPGLKNTESIEDWGKNSPKQDEDSDNIF